MSLFILFRNPNLCQLFLDGHFSVQINHIAGTGKSVNHAGDQENKNKIQSGLIAICGEKAAGTIFLHYHVWFQRLRKN